jgi:hypothetical protein
MSSLVGLVAKAHGLQDALKSTGPIRALLLSQVTVRSSIFNVVRTGRSSSSRTSTTQRHTRLTGCRLFPFNGIHTVPYTAGVFVYDFTDAIHDPKRPMFRQCMPGVKRYVFGKLILLRAIEVLPRDIDRCYLMERRLFLFPFGHRVFNTQTFRCSWLHQKLEGCITFVKRETQRIT